MRAVIPHRCMTVQKSTVDCNEILLQRDFHRRHVSQNVFDRFSYKTRYERVLAEIHFEVPKCFSFGSSHKFAGYVINVLDRIKINNCVLVF